MEDEIKIITDFTKNRQKLDYITSYIRAGAINDNEKIKEILKTIHPNDLYQTTQNYKTIDVPGNLLHLAITYENLEICKELLSKDKLFLIVKNDSDNILHTVVKTNNIEILSFFLPFMTNDDFTCQNKEGKIPLQYAIENGKFELCKMIIKKMYLLDKNRKDLTDKNLYNLAKKIKNDYVNIVQLLEIKELD